MTTRPLIAIGAAAIAALLTLGSAAASAHEVSRHGPAPHMGVPYHATAYPATPHIDQRQARQQGRIAHGVRSGQLTRHEAHRLERQQRTIHHMERRAKADGIVTHGERSRILQAQNRASRSIRNQKHDRQHY
ncbi:MAG: hypothetical protein ABI589_15875 [Burkholderiales bacterium]